MNRVFIEGNTEIISISETQLNDSSLFVGYVKQILHKDGYPEVIVPSEVWITGTDIITFTDSTGHYSIKTVPGSYSIRCQNSSNHWENLIEGIDDIEVGSNQEIHIDFYIGYAVE